MPIVLLIFVFAFGKGWISDLLRFRPLVLLGDLVFPCYILHPMVIDLVIKAYASSETPATPTGINVLFFYTLAVLLVISYIVTFVLPGKKTK